MAPRRSPWRGLALVLGVAIAGAACGSSGGGDDAACGAITREALDPAYLVHVVSDDASLEFTSDPPTSGPHQPSPPITGVVADPIPRPVQVGILEQGDVLLQHDPDLAGADLTALEALAGDGVVVAPNPNLPAPIVATAWLYKRTCDELDTEALQEMIDERQGKGPDG